MSVLLLSTIGGLISALSTSLGSLLAPLFTRFENLRRYHMSMDFALGVMLSAVAFSLVGPELVRGKDLFLVLSGIMTGGTFIIVTHKMIEWFNGKVQRPSSNLLLISALVFHNLPEGMGAGASLAGMALHDAIPLQVALSLQNIVEGLLLTLLLQGLGLRLIFSVAGGVASGILEMSGAIVSGLFLQETNMLLPFFLSLAGGAMMTSVGLEIYESSLKGKPFKITHFVSGLFVIPLSNFLFQLTP